MRHEKRALGAHGLLVALLIPAATSGPAEAAATPATRQWVLSSARATGAGSPPAEYVTALRVVNPGAAAALVDLTFLPQSPLDTTDTETFRAAGDNRAKTPVRVVVGPGQTWATEDAVGSLFGGAAPFGIPAGGIRVDSDLPVVVTSRTFVANARNGAGVGGTFGISVPSSVLDEAVAAADTAYLPFAAVSDDASRGFRANLILLNAAGAESVATVTLLRGDGSVAGRRGYALAPAAAAQQNDVARSFGVPGRDENLTVVVTIEEGGPVFAGLTPVDNALNAPSFTSSSKVFVADDGAFPLLLEDGGFGFTGRADVVNGSFDFLSATLVLDTCPSPSLVQTFLLQAFGTGSGKNTTFTKGENGQTTFDGSADGASWTGLIEPGVDGTLRGSITYTRSSGAASCPAVSKAFPFQGARGARLEVTP